MRAAGGAREDVRQARNEPKPFPDAPEDLVDGQVYELPERVREKLDAKFGRYNAERNTLTAVD